MQIWVDADACPVVIREILYRAAKRKHILVTFVANQNIPLPASPYLSMLQVPKGFDIADDEIVKRTNTGDIVITSDIPLAAEVLEKGAFVLSARGERYTQNNIKARLNIRDFMETMRSSGVQTGGPPPLNKRDRQMFDNGLDQLLTKYCR